MPCRLKDAVSVIHPVVGCVGTQNWVLAFGLRGLDALQRGPMAAETVELGTIYLVDLVGSTQVATAVGRALAGRPQPYDRALSDLVG